MELRKLELKSQIARLKLEKARIAGKIRRLKQELKGLRISQ